MTLLLALTSSIASAQYTAVRVNTLALATGTLNAGVDVAVSDKWSVDVSAMWSPVLNNATSLTAGVRRWRFEPSVGWFWGMHTSTAYYDIKDKIGWVVGAGSSVGYSWILSKRWNFALEGGLGVFYIYDKWLVPDTSPLEDIIIRHRKRVMLLPSKFEVSFSYLF
ncbi:MAG: DUF3575 domain-containing protein [Rikenellaceae bacterium]